jgi:hypothetical protein
VHLTSEENKESLLMARVCELTVNPAPPLEGGLQLQEPEAHVFLGSDEKLEGWYLNTGPTSHITKRVEAFSKLNHMV